MWVILLRYPSYLVLEVVRATRAMKRDLTIPRTTYWSYSRSQVAVQHHNDTCEKRRLAWSHCRATSRWTFCSCPLIGDPKTLFDMSDYKVTVRSLRVLPERVAPSGRVAPWPGVILTQIYSSLDERSLHARIVEMRRNAIC